MDGQDLPTKAVAALKRLREQYSPAELDLITDLLAEPLVTRLRDQVKELGRRVELLAREGEALKTANAALTVSYAEFNRMKQQQDKLALYFRERYGAEIAAGRHGAFADAADCAIYYLSRERDLAGKGFWGRLRYLLWGL
jgi:hypothetical protein